MSAADFNEDGLDDLAVATRDSDLILCDTVILIRKGNSFAQAGSVKGAGDTFTCPGLLSADLNVDGHIDVDAAAFSVALGDGSGSFTEKKWPNRPWTDTAVYGQDLDCNKVLDAIDLSAGTVQAWQGMGDLKYEIANTEISKSEVLARLADMNGDVEPDIITVGPAGLRIFFGDVKFEFAGATVLSPGPMYTEIEIGDLNEDGEPDLTVLGSDVVQVFLSRP